MVRSPSARVVMLGLALVGCPSTSVVVGGSSGGEDSGMDASGTEGPNTETGGSGDGDGDVVEDHRTYFIGETLKFDGGGRATTAT